MLREQMRRVQAKCSLCRFGEPKGLSAPRLHRSNVPVNTMIFISKICVIFYPICMIFLDGKVIRPWKHQTAGCLVPDARSLIPKPQHRLHGGDKNACQPAWTSWVRPQPVRPQSTQAFTTVRLFPLHPSKALPLCQSFPDLGLCPA